MKNIFSQRKEERRMDEEYQKYWLEEERRMDEEYQKYELEEERRIREEK